MTTSPAQDPAALDEFLTRIQESNPFLANRVDRPLADDLIDVPGIHDAEFRQLARLARQAHTSQRGIGAVVWGEAGMGKTHLLARLYRWSQKEQPACFVYLHNFQVQPGQAGVSLLQGVLSFLTANRGRAWTQTRLFRLLNAVLVRALKGNSGTVAQFRAAYRDWLGYLAERDPSQGVLLDPAVSDALFRFFHAANRAGRTPGDLGPIEPLRWLGAPVGSDPAGWEGPVPERPLLDNMHAKKVLALLCLLTWSIKEPFLLCLDQVDNLDEEQVRSLSRFLHDLLDSAGNLLVITTGVRETLQGFQRRGVITETSWDRVGQFTFALGRIGLGQARGLLQAHVRPWQQAGAEIPEVAAVVQRDPLFPLGTRWFEQRVGRLSEVRPRDLLGWAGERWLQLQQALATQDGVDWLERWLTEPTAAPTSAGIPSREESVSGPADPVRQWLIEARQQRRDHPELKTPTEERLRHPASKILEAAAQHRLLPGDVRVQRIRHTTGQVRPAFDLVVRQTWPTGVEVRTGVRFLLSHDSKSTIAAYRKLLKEAEDKDQLLLVTDARSEPPLGNRGQKRMEELQELGPGKFRHLNLSFEEILELDAVLTLVERADRAAPTEEGALPAHEILARLLRQPAVANHRLLSCFLVPASAGAAGSATEQAHPG